VLCPTNAASETAALKPVKDSPVITPCADDDATTAVITA
jgi:hypothetical protein